MDPVKYIKKEYLLDQMSQFVSSYFGLIERTWFRENLVLKCPTAVSRVKCRHFGFGTDLDFSTAVMKSMAEALERYTLKYFCPLKETSSIIYKKTCQEMETLGYTCFYPDDPFYEDFVYENFPFCKKIIPDLKTDWVATKRFLDNQLIWLPASLIYSNAHNTLTNILKSPTSNGMSCSFFHSAVENSILELIERDTFLYMWLAKSPGEEIVFDKVSNPSLRELLSIINCKIKQIKVVYKCTDIKIPCVFILFKGRKKYNEPAFLIAGAADTDIERTCYRALLEFVQSYNSFFYKQFFLRDRIKKMASESSPKIGSFLDHTVFYAMYKNFCKCEFLFHVTGQKKLSELSEKWTESQKKTELLKSALKDKRVFIVDVTPIEIAKSHVYITRAYSPDLIDIDYRDDQLFRSSSRKKRVDMVDKTFGGKTDCLNSDPHCYP